MITPRSRVEITGITAIPHVQSITEDIECIIMFKDFSEGRLRWEITKLIATHMLNQLIKVKNVTKDLSNG